MQDQNEIKLLAKSLASQSKAMGIDMKLNVAQQIIARMGGFKSWQALKAQGGSKVSAAKSSASQSEAGALLSGGFRCKIFLETTSTSDCGDYPEFASFNIDADFIGRVKTLQQMLHSNGLSEVREHFEIDWAEDHEYRMQSTELVVYRNTFMFTAYPKHADYKAETRTANIDGVEKSVADARRKGEFFVAYNEDVPADNSHLLDSLLNNVECFRVEYDLDYFGGDYSGTGKFVYVPEDTEGINDKAKLFQMMTGIDPAHIIHLTSDECYALDGNSLD